MLQSWRKFKRKQYGVYLKKSAAFCSKRKLDSLETKKQK